MRIIKKDDFLKSRERCIGWIRSGAVFIYPTDTLYGIGCNAKVPGAVRAIRRAKKRDKSPFSVIAPSKDWIRDNCSVGERWLKKLPGAFTLVLPMRRKCVSVEVSRESLGVRIPRNWFADIVSEAGIPVVTTSVNISGTKPVFSLKNVPQQIKTVVDFAVDDGRISGHPSTLVLLTGKRAKVVKRK